VARYCQGDVAPSGLEIPGDELLTRMNAAAPILIGYDGSDTARRAVHEAAELFGSRQALVVTVWEPGLAYEASAMTADPTALGPEPVDPATAQEVDDASKARADRVAEDGAALAKSLGLQAEPLAVADEGNVADAIVELARKRNVAALVVGSRGLTGLRARLEGVPQTQLRSTPRAPSSWFTTIERPERDRAPPGHEVLSLELLALAALHGKRRFPRQV
jgi:nucleotide-binding universal stress UspA family protein